MPSDLWLSNNLKYHPNPKGINYFYFFYKHLNSFIKKHSILYQTELKLIMKLDISYTKSHIKFHDFWIYP
jgi:hypothetical protein